MKKLLSVVLSVAMLCSLLVTTSVSAAMDFGTKLPTEAVSFVEDFETDGNYSGISSFVNYVGKQGNTWAVGTKVVDWYMDAYIGADPVAANADNKVFTYHRKPYTAPDPVDNNQPYLQRVTTIINDNAEYFNSDIVVIEQDVYIESGNDTTTIFFAHAVDGLRLYELDFSTDLSVTLKGISNQTIKNAYSCDKWFKVRTVFNYTNDTMTLIVDNTKFNTVGFQAVSDSGFGSLVYDLGRNQKGHTAHSYFYVDNIKVNNIHPADAYSFADDFEKAGTYDSNAALVKRIGDQGNTWGIKGAQYSDDTSGHNDVSATIVNDIHGRTGNVLQINRHVFNYDPETDSAISESARPQIQRVTTFFNDNSSFYSTNKVTVEQDVYIPTGNDSTSTFYGSGAAANTRIYQLNFNNNGNLDFRYGDGTTLKYPRDTWFKFTIVLDYNAQTVTATVNGQSISCPFQQTTDVALGSFQFEFSRCDAGKTHKVESFFWVDNLTVSKEKDPTIEDRIDAEFTWDDVSTQAISAVKENLTLPTSFTTSKNEVVNVSWASSDAAINAQTGAVTRPVDADEKAVTLTATFTNDSSLNHKVAFNLTVLGNYEYLDRFDIEGEIKGHTAMMEYKGPQGDYYGVESGHSTADDNLMLSIVENPKPVAGEAAGNKVLSLYRPEVTADRLNHRVKHMLPTPVGRDESDPNTITTVTSTQRIYIQKEEGATVNYAFFVNDGANHRIAEMYLGNGGTEIYIKNAIPNATLTGNKEVRFPNAISNNTWFTLKLEYIFKDGDDDRWRLYVDDVLLTPIDGYRLPWFEAGRVDSIGFFTYEPIRNCKSEELMLIDDFRIAKTVERLPEKTLENEYTWEKTGIGQNQGAIFNDITFPTSYVSEVTGETYNLEWSSSNPEVISATGKVTQGEFDQKVILTTSFNKNQETHATYYFNVRVPAVGAYYLQDNMSTAVTVVDVDDLDALTDEDGNDMWKRTYDKVPRNINLSITDDPVIAGERVLRFYHRPGNITKNEVERTMRLLPVPTAAAGTVYVSMRLNIQENPEAYFRVLLHSEERFTYFTFGTDGKITADGSANTNVKINYPQGRWFDFQVEVMYNKGMNLYIDGEKVNSDPIAFALEPTAGVKGVEFEMNRGNWTEAQVAYVDDIFVRETGPFKYTATEITTANAEGYPTTSFVEGGILKSVTIKKMGTTDHGNTVKLYVSLFTNGGTQVFDTAVCDVDGSAPVGKIVFNVNMPLPEDVTDCSAKMFMIDTADFTPMMVSFGKTYVARKPHIFVAGDSIAATSKAVVDGIEQSGWGETLAKSVNSDAVTLVNCAVGGKSSRSFIDQGNFDSLFKQASAGDLVFIQFGHNDSKTDQGRYTSPDGSVDTVGSFKWYLKRYITEARERGMTPVLVNAPAHLSTIDFENKSCVDPATDAYMKAVVELAKAEGLAYVDVYTWWTQQALAAVGGYDEVATWYCHYSPGVQDNSHQSDFGATMVSQYVASEVVRQLPEFATWFK